MRRLRATALLVLFKTGAALYRTEPRFTRVTTAGQCDRIADLTLLKPPLTCILME